uniref:membrane-spanning 4-domains subfamily A member 4D-like n=1 Tax=Semicossyphus pulcher TaxID=241346 RepID=UPI0037E8439C
MKKTFVCDETMIVTIPIGSLRDGNDGQLMPEKFHCVYKDYYKVFAIKGRPKPLGAAQALAGVFIVTLGLIFGQARYYDWFMISIYTLPSVVVNTNAKLKCNHSHKYITVLMFVVSGMLSYAAGRSPNMHVTKLSFALNIISFFWAVAAVVAFAVFLNGPFYYSRPKLQKGIFLLIITLLLVEKLIALFLIYWLSKAVCRQHFNTLPIILLKQGD